MADTPEGAESRRHTYRLIVVCKNLEVSEPPQQRLFDDYRYFFYLTNDHDSTPEEIVFTANDRCQQENLLAQLAACRALHAPVDNLLSNNAYMLITSLAWNLKAWLALSLPGASDSTQEARSEPKRRLLTMEFRTFVNFLVRMPAQIVRTGRRLIIRLLGWNEWQPVLLRLAARLCRPLRC